MKLHLDTVLDSKRKSLLNKFAWTKDYGFYLAGGTALSLMYGHRKSEDFDFFKEGDFDINWLKDQLNRQGFEYRVTYQVPNTLYISVNGVKISFIGVKKLTLIYPLISTPYFNIASDKEIGIMKLITIPARRELKDYVDLYYLTKKYDINELIELIPQKYGAKQNLFVLKKALLYTEDLLENVEFIGKPIPLKTMKKHFEEVVEFI